MKKVAVLTLLATLNLGGAAGELIFSDGFESGWPNAWAEAVGWSAFVVKDSTDALVGPVVGWWTDGDVFMGGDQYGVGVPVVAAIIDGEKVIFKVNQGGLVTGRRLLFELEDCMGQAYICEVNCFPYPDPLAENPRKLSHLLQRSYAIGPDNVLYKAEPPHVPVDTPWTSYATVSTGGTGGGFDITCHDTTDNEGFVMWPAEPVVDLDTLFTPPFTVE